MEKYTLTHRNLEYNNILIYTKHINDLIKLYTPQMSNDRFVYKSNDIFYLKDYLISILKLIY